MRLVTILVFFLLLSVGALSPFNGVVAADQPEGAVGDGTLRRIRVPILMYHYVSELPADADAYRVELTVQPGVFDAHMRYLSDEGYTTISLYDLNSALLEGTSLPRKPVILTFDDGYIDHYTSVFPALQEYGFTGTFFVITGRADHGDPGYMTWAQIAEMAKAGMSMESHTKSHADLRGRSYEFLVYELLGSFQSLAAHIGREPRMFCYPGGRYDENTLSVIRTLPVSLALTTRSGALHTTDGRLELARLRVTGDMGTGGLAHLLSSTQ